LQEDAGASGKISLDNSFLRSGRSQRKRWALRRSTQCSTDQQGRHARERRRHLARIPRGTRLVGFFFVPVVRLMTTRETTKIVRRELERVCKDFTSRLAPMGFVRTKKMFWTRCHPPTVDFVHLFRSGSSYGAPINYSVEVGVHFGIRVLNDTFVAAALNGPSSDAERCRTGRYHLRFNAQTGSTFERCVDDLARFVVEEGEPWLKRFADASELLRSADSPLGSREAEALTAALAGRGSPENEAASLRILGIKQ
jgi:hypothetical protein